MVEYNQQIRRHYQSPEPAYIIPFVQAVITGFLLALCAGTLSYFAKLSQPIPVFMISFTVITSYTWLAKQHGWTNDQKEKLHIYSPTPAAPEPPPQPLEVWVNQGNTQTRHRLVATPEEMKVIAQEILNNRKRFTEDDLVGFGKPFSQKRLQDIREDLVKNKFMKWVRTDEEGNVDPKGGVVWTEKGIETLRTYAMTLPYPSLVLRKK